MPHPADDERNCQSLSFFDRSFYRDLSPLTSIPSEGSPTKEALFFLSQSQSQFQHVSLPSNQTFDTPHNTSHDYRQRQQYWTTVLGPMNSLQATYSHPSVNTQKEKVSSSLECKPTPTQGTAFLSNRSAQPTMSLIENMMTSDGVWGISTPKCFNEYASLAVSTGIEPSYKHSLPYSPAFHSSSSGAKAMSKSKIRRFKCPLCPAAFIQKGDMQRHFRVKGKIYCVARNNIMPEGAGCESFSYTWYSWTVG